MSWRDSTPVPAQADIDELLDVALDMAEKRLSERGEFFPFSVVVERNGDRQVIVSDADSAQRAHELNFEAVALMRTRIRAAALAVDVRIPETGSDGIEVHLEHVDGPAMRVLEPYRVAGGSVVAGDLEGFTAERRIWR
ncbi:hypothetical protein [Nocardia arizonensis]|uniref:hypothetical protein n=1 Tax=Nocardia arizonensis TaxID=1141647 RepID=UPI0006D23C13|nr:hypothetical protein [Nocardia arizonensis]